MDSWVAHARAVTDYFNCNCVEKRLGEGYKSGAKRQVASRGETGMYVPYVFLHVRNRHFGLKHDNTQKVDALGTIGSAR